MDFSSIPFVARATPAGGGPAFAAAFVAGSYVFDDTEFVTNKTFNGVAIGAADADRTLFIYMFMAGNESATVTLSINGGAGISPIAEIRPAGQRQVLVFEADVPTGTTADFAFTNSAGTFNSTGMAVIRVVGAHTAATATAGASGPDIPVSINTVAGDTVFVGVMSRFGAAADYYTPPSGFTEHVDALLRPAGSAHAVMLASGTAAGASPETFTTTPAGFEEYAVLALRLRAA